jgi:hypothetical protein
MWVVGSSRHEPNDVIAGGSGVVLDNHGVTVRVLGLSFYSISLWMMCVCVFWFYQE